MTSFYKMIILTLSIFLIAGCDNQTTPSSSQNEQTPQSDPKSSSDKIENFTKQNVNDKSVIQKMIVEGVKKKLPILVDQATLMSDVSIKGDVFIYHFDVKGIPESVIKMPYWQDNMKKSIKAQYCKNDDKVKMFREFFPDGATYNYFLDQKLIYSNTITPAECHS